MNAYEQAIRPKITNKSGIVGVRRTKRKVRRAGMGERNAKAAAIALRQEWEESLRVSVEGKATGHAV